MLELPDLMGVSEAQRRRGARSRPRSKSTLGLGHDLTSVTGGTEALPQQRPAERGAPSRLGS